MAATSTRLHLDLYRRCNPAPRPPPARRPLSKLLAGPILPGETRAELDLLAEEDRRLAERGLAALMDSGGGIRHKHVEELVPGDRADRARAEGARVGWLTERARRLRVRPRQ